jgi:hypothetical protein
MILNSLISKMTFFYHDFKCIMNSTNMKKQIKLKIVVFMKYASKTRSWALLLMKGFEDLNSVNCTWVLDTTIKVTKKNIPLEQHLATTYRRLTQKEIGFNILEHFLGSLNNACTELVQMVYVAQIHIFMHLWIKCKPKLNWSHAYQLKFFWYLSNHAHCGGET